MSKIPRISIVSANQKFRFHTLFLFIPLFLLSLAAKAQTEEDSLRRLLKPNQYDTAQLLILCELVEVAPDGVWQKYNEQLGQKAATMKTSPDPVVRRSAMHYEAVYLDNVAYGLFNKGDIQPAIDYNLRALRIYEDIKDSRQIASSYNNLGYVYSSQGDLDMALKYYTRSYELYDKANNDDGRALGLNNMGHVYEQRATMLMEAHGNTTTVNELLRKALSCYEKSLQLHIKAKDEEGTMYSSINTGTAYLNLLKLWENNTEKQDSLDYFAEQAIGYFRRSLAISEKTGLQRGLAMSNGNIAKYYLYKKQNKTAERYALKADSIAHELGFPSLIRDTGKLLYTIYKADGKSEEALRYYEEFIAMRDSVQNDKNRKGAIQKRLQYEYEKKLVSDSLIAAEKERLVAAERSQERTQRTALVIVAAVFAVLLVRLRYNIRQRKKAYESLEEKNREIQQQAEVMVKQTKEIARYQSQMNPHFVFNAMNSIQGHVMSDEKEKTIEQLQHFSRLMRQTLNNSDRELITLETEFDFLWQYFSFEKERFASTITFEIRSDADAGNTLIPPMLIQPFIENALKHAALDQAEQPMIVLSVEEKNDLLLVTITDNGRGMKNDLVFRSEKPHATEIVHSRIKLLFENQGRPVPDQLIRVNSVSGPSSGTEVRFYLPLITQF